MRGGCGNGARQAFDHHRWWVCASGLGEAFRLTFFPSSVCSFLSLLCLSLLSSLHAGNVHPLLRAGLWVLAKKRWILCLPQEKSPTALTVWAQIWSSQITKATCISQIRVCCCTPSVCNILLCQMPFLQADKKKWQFFLWIFCHLYCYCWSVIILLPSGGGAVLVLSENCTPMCCRVHTHWCFAFAYIEGSLSQCRVDKLEDCLSISGILGIEKWGMIWWFFFLRSGCWARWIRGATNGGPNCCSW